MIPENARPAIIAPPKPRQSGLEIEIGMSPNIVVRDVRRIGSSLLSAASAIAGLRAIPTVLFRFILSTINMALVTTMPKRARTPIRAGNDSGVAVIPKTIKTPEMARGIRRRTNSA